MATCDICEGTCALGRAYGKNKNVTGELEFWNSAGTAKITKIGLNEAFDVKTCFRVERVDLSVTEATTVDPTYFELPVSDANLVTSSGRGRVMNGGGDFTYTSKTGNKLGVTDPGSNSGVLDRGTPLRFQYDSAEALNGTVTMAAENKTDADAEVVISKTSGTLVNGYYCFDDIQITDGASGGDKIQFTAYYTPDDANKVQATGSIEIRRDIPGGTDCCWGYHCLTDFGASFVENCQNPKDPAHCNDALGCIYRKTTETCDHYGYPVDADGYCPSQPGTDPCYILTSSDDCIYT